MRKRLLPILALLALLAGAAAAAEVVLFEKASPFSTVVVTADGPYRILKLRGREGDVEQSRMDVRRPEFLFHEYSRMQLLGLLQVPEPKRILIVGLGGASLTRALAAALPETRIDSVEIDPVVVEAARRYFQYREGPRVQTVIEDARAFARDTDARYDLVFLDAFEGDEIPYPLRTREFYESVRELLRPGGVVVSNFIRRSRLYDRDRATLRSVFPCVQGYQGLGNVVVVAGAELRVPTEEEVAALSRRFGNAYPLAAFERSREETPDGDPAARPLTDAEAP